MSEDAKKPQDEMPALPETFLEQFRCCRCTKYLRPPIRTVCKKGHKVCDICFTALGASHCPVSPECQRISEDIQDVAVETMMKSLKLPISCKNHDAGCDFSGSLEDVIAQEEDCPFRSVQCVVISCYQDTSFNGLEDHMARCHPKMSTGDWEIIRPIELHTTDNAGKADRMAKTGKGGDEQNGEETEMQTLERKARSIFNKLTPQKFDTLLGKFQELGINTEEKLQRFIQLVFEKAIDEPGLSSAYARMCQELAMNKDYKVPSAADPTKKASFPMLLITRCQREFERDYMKGIDCDEYERKIKEAATEEERKKIKAQFESIEMKARLRSLGNIRFIGELYNLKMLTARIMHECIIKLLAAPPTDEESIESLCELLTTVGKDLENETTRRLAAGPEEAPGIRPLNDYFKRMAEIVKSKQTTSRVRSMLQDLIDLRRDSWRSRRDVAGPKTIDQIHNEVGAVPTGHAGVLALANYYTCICGCYRSHPSCGVGRCGNCNRYAITSMAYAMRSWRHGGTRFFATLFNGTDSFWQLWVTATCGKTAAEKFRAEIRLSSNLTPECNNVYYRPVLHFESPILSEKTSTDGYTACLRVHKTIVAKHIKGVVAIADLQADTAIPFMVNVYEKVFLIPDKADIEEKEESNGV